MADILDQFSLVNSSAEGENNVDQSSETDITHPKPGEYYVIKRHGGLVPYNDAKIAEAMMKAFMDVEGVEVAQASSTRAKVQSFTRSVTETISRRNPSGEVFISNLFRTW